jgi:hypothetical protein
MKMGINKPAQYNTANHGAEYRKARPHIFTVLAGIITSGFPVRRLRWQILFRILHLHSCGSYR